MKKCSKCCETKELIEFSKRSAAKDGLYAYCKPCACKEAKKWNYATPEKFRINLKKLIRIIFKFIMSWKISY